MNSKRPLIFLIITAILYVGAMVYIGFTLHRIRWYNDLSYLLYGLIFGMFYMLVVGVFAFLFVFYQQKHQTLKTHTMITSLVLMFTVPLLGLISYRTIDNANAAEYYRFTPQKWEVADDNMRGRLIDSFIEQYDIIGYEKEGVEALLGAADDEDDVSMHYYLGEYRSFIAIDPFIYYIELEDNTVTYASIISG